MPKMILTIELNSFDDETVDKLKQFFGKESTPAKTPRIPPAQTRAQPQPVPQLVPPPTQVQQPVMTQPSGGPPPQHAAVQPLQTRQPLQAQGVTLPGLQQAATQLVKLCDSDRPLFDILKRYQVQSITQLSPTLHQQFGIDLQIAIEQVQAAG